MLTRVKSGRWTLRLSASICRLLLADTAAGTPAGPMYGEHLGCSLAVYLAEQFGQTRTQRCVTASSLPGPVLKRVGELIETRLNTPIGLQDLARAVAAGSGFSSRSHLCSLFRRYVGVTPHKFRSLFYSTKKGHWHLADAPCTGHTKAGPISLRALRLALA